MSMLSLKHVEESGYESIRQAHSICFWPKGQEGRKPEGKPLFEAFGCTGESTGGYCCFSSGKIYVMNDAGSTVGTYYLK